MLVDSATKKQRMKSDVAKSSQHLKCLKGGSRMEEGGRWTAEGGRRKAEGGKWKVEGGRWM